MKSNPPAISGKSDLMAWEPLGISDPSEEGYVDMKVSTFNTNNKSIISSTNMTSMFFLLMFTSHYELGSGFNNILPSSIVYKRSSSLIVPVIPFTKSTIRRHVLSTGRRRKVQTMGKTKRGKHFDFSLYTSYHSSLSNNSINESNDSSDNHFEDDLNTVNQHSTIRATEELENLQLINARLQEENDQLKRELKSQQQHNSYYASRRPTIVLESFEPGGNGKVLLNDRMNPEQQHGLDSSSPPEMEISFMAQDQQQWCDEVEADSEECPVEPGVLFQDAVRDRAYWLVGLLAAQSCSGFILARNEELLQNHPEIIFFLTMLIGAGGNAGNQASVRGKCGQRVFVENRIKSLSSPEFLYLWHHVFLTYLYQNWMCRQLFGVLHWGH